MRASRSRRCLGSIAYLLASLALLVAVQFDSPVMAASFTALAALSGSSGTRGCTCMPRSSSFVHGAGWELMRRNPLWSRKVAE
jgi:hypothetical protein